MTSKRSFCKSPYDSLILSLHNIIISTLMSNWDYNFELAISCFTFSKFTYSVTNCQKPLLDFFHLCIKIPFGYVLDKYFEKFTVKYLLF